MYRFKMVAKGKPSLDEMWQFIDNIMRPNELVPDKTILTYEQVFSVYSKLVEIDEMFKEIAQVAILKKELNKLDNNSK
ncbi:MAG: hypothetical protein LV477_01785 [Candidatus Nitrosotalea sp.]|nr:hypothetical protein [Candidatus Nitrosotalea sp.]